MKILVTGATGFIGRALCKYLKAFGHHVVELNSRNCDLTQSESLTHYDHPFYDQIYHLAAWTQAGDFCLYHPGEQWVINQLINTHLLNWWQRYQPQAKLIAMGTSCAYAPDREMIEDNYLIGMPIDSLFTYAMTKRMLYVGMLALHQQFGLTYLYIIPSTLYGPDYPMDGRQMHFIFDLIRKILRGQLYHESVVLWGGGSQRREVVFMDDFIRILVTLSNQVDNDLVNIGAGEEFTIRYYAQQICEQVGYPYEEIQFDPSRYVGASSKCLNIQKLKTLIPDLKLIPLPLGLEKTISWFRDSLTIKGKENFEEAERP